MSAALLTALLLAAAAPHRRRRRHRHPCPTPLARPSRRRTWSTCCASCVTGRRRPRRGPRTTRSGWSPPPGGHVRPHERLRPRVAGTWPSTGASQLDRISSIVAQRDGHDEGTAARQREFNGSSLHNRWHSEGDNRLYWTSQKTYGLGTDTAEGPRSTRSTTTSGSTRRPTARSRATATWASASSTANHTDVRPADEEAEAAWPSSPYVLYSEQRGLDRSRRRRPASA